MKLDELLKAKGFTDADIAVLTPTMRETLEATYSGMEAERDTLRTVNDEWQSKLSNEYQPAITKAEKIAADARMETAKYREQVAIAKEFGYLTEEAVAAHAPAPPTPATFDESKFMRTADLGRLAQGQGKAMAVYVDIAAEHGRLFGKSLDEFSTLYDDFLAAQQRNPQATIRATWEAKYKVPERRAEIAKQEQEVHDKQVADAALAKYISEHGGNPNLQMRAPSSQPFIPAKAAGDKGLPWERGTPGQLKTQRIERANKIQAQAELVH